MTDGLIAVVPEENLLGEVTSVGPAPHMAEGYSAATHEIAHLLHTVALTDADRDLVRDVYDAKRKADLERREKRRRGEEVRGPDVLWPDGVNQDPVTGDNYSSGNEYEFFAQLSNVYLGTNHGTDPATGRSRHNGAEWVRVHEPELLGLLERLYGPVGESAAPAEANPVAATGADNATYEAFRDFMNGVATAPDTAGTPYDAAVRQAEIAREAADGDAGRHAGADGDPGQDQPPRTLGDFLPEDKWWTFYIDPKNHQAALDAFPDDPGSYYDHDRSPGFQRGMVSAYAQFLDDPDTVVTPMDSTAYRTMHGLATAHLGRVIGWSGGGATQFPLRGDALADDIFDERIGDQLLVYDMTSHDWSKPLAKPRPVTILTRFLHNNPSLATNYGKDAAPDLVDTLFQQHYARVSDPDADDAVKLASIVRTIRALHVVHPFQDGNLRSNVQILLPKLLLEQGLRPVVPDNMYSLFQGGHSVPQMVDSLIRNGALDTGGPRPTLPRSVGQVTEAGETEAGTGFGSGADTVAGISEATASEGDAKLHAAPVGEISTETDTGTTEAAPEEPVAEHLGTLTFSAAGVAYDAAVRQAEIAREAADATVHDAETELSRIEQSIQDARALPTAEQVREARVAWRQARAETRSIERMTSSGAPSPDLDAAREREQAARRRWSQLQERHQGRITALSTARAALPAARAAVETARENQARVWQSTGTAVSEAWKEVQRRAQQAGTLDVDTAGEPTPVVPSTPSSDRSSTPTVSATADGVTEPDGGRRSEDPAATSPTVEADAALFRAIRSLLPQGTPVPGAEAGSLVQVPASVVREHARAWWSEMGGTPETTPEALEQVFQQVADRVAQGEPHIPYMLEDATGGLADPDRGGMAFGVEIEFELDEGLTGPEKEARYELIVAELAKAGLTTQNEIAGYHQAVDRGYAESRDGWLLERDPTVGVELVSPILRDTRQTWEDLRTAVRVIRRNGGQITARAGGHVHVSTGQFGHDVRAYEALRALFTGHQDVLFRLAMNPRADAHRGDKHARPLPEGPPPYTTVRDVPSMRNEDALSFKRVRGKGTDHVEFRAWDGSLDEAEIQANVSISLGLVHAALRLADDPDRLPSAYEQVGSHSAVVQRVRHAGSGPGSVTVFEPDAPEVTAGLRGMLDRIFWRPANRAQAMARFAVTSWYGGLGAQAGEAAAELLEPAGIPGLERLASLGGLFVNRLPGGAVFHPAQSAADEQVAAAADRLRAVFPGGNAFVAMLAFGRRPRAPHAFGLGGSTPLTVTESVPLLKHLGWSPGTPLVIALPGEDTPGSLVKWGSELAAALGQPVFIPASADEYAEVTEIPSSRLADVPGVEIFGPSEGEMTDDGDMVVLPGAAWFRLPPGPTADGTGQTDDAWPAGTGLVRYHYTADADADVAATQVSLLASPPVFDTAAGPASAAPEGENTTAAGLAAAWEAHAGALSVLGAATAEAVALERDSGDERAVEHARAKTDDARRRLEDVEARLLALGVAADALGAARGTGDAVMTGLGNESDAADAFWAVPADAHGHRNTARQVTEEDLPSQAPTPTASETAGHEEVEAAGSALSPEATVIVPLSSAGDPMQGVQAAMRDVELGSHAVLAAPVAAPGVRALPVLPSRSLVAFAPRTDVPSAAGEARLRKLAFAVAAAGLRNRRVGAALPRAIVTGFARQAVGPRAAEVGMLRAQSTGAVFQQMLERALADLQQGLPVGETRLAVTDFRVEARGLTQVPDDLVTQGRLAGLTRAELGRQATIAVLLPPDAAAVQTLDLLRDRERELRDSPLDVDALARSVLRLGAGTQVGEARRRELFALVDRAQSASMATSLAALRAFHLMELGLGVPGRTPQFTFNGSRVPGLNLLPYAGGELDTAHSDILKPNGFGDFDVVDTVPTRFSQGVTPFVVAGTRAPGGLAVRTPDGSTHVVTEDELVELIAAYAAREGLTKDTEIVLAIPFAGSGYADLPRKVADRTGLTVLAHTGEVQVRSRSASAGNSTQPHTIDVIHRPGRPQGDWFASRPGLAPDPDDDAPAWHRDVVTQPIISLSSGEQIGRVSHHPAEFAGHSEDHTRHLDQMTTFVHYNPATGQFGPELELPRPGPEEDSHKLELHGEPGFLVMAMKDGTSRRVDKPGAAGWLRRRKSLTSRPKHHWLDLFVCFSGSPEDRAVPAANPTWDGHPGSFVPDPLRDLSMAQHLANALDRWVRLSYGAQATLGKAGRYLRAVFADARGRLGRFDLVRPHPSGAELDRRVRVAGFAAGDQVSDEERARTLVLVEALRLVFGPYVDDASDYDELLRGVAAVDHIWSGDPDFDTAGHFTLDLLLRVIAAHPEAASGVTQDAARRVLAAAAAQWAANPDEPTLADLVNLPAVDDAVRYMPDPVAEASVALQIPRSRVGVAERSRIFWARVRAEETLAAPGLDADDFIARVQHLPPGPQHFEDREDVVRLLTRGFAGGRDMADVNVAAAYNLELAGAFAGASLAVAVDGKRGGGQDFTGEGLPAEVDLAQFRTLAGLVDAPWTQGSGKPAPYLLRVAQDHNDPNFLQVFFGGRAYRAHTDELPELMARDLELMRRELAVPVVLVYTTPPADAESMARGLTRSLGRSVWWSPFPADLSGKGDAGLPVLTFQASAAAHNSLPGLGWSEVRPTLPVADVDGVPLPTPLPRSAGQVGQELQTAGVKVPATASEPALSRGQWSGVVGDGGAATVIVLRSSAGDPMQGVQAAMRDVGLGSPSVPAAPVPAPGVRALPALPSHSLVAFAPRTVVPSVEGEEAVERLASDVAEAGLRNRREDVALPRIDITGYGSEARTSRRRALSSRELFLSALDRALNDLQRQRGDMGLTAADFTVVHRGLTKVPDAVVGLGDLVDVSRSELGRQAVIAVSLPPEAAALQTLDVLRGRDRELRDSALDVAAIARRVLHLAPDTAVGEPERAELFALVTRAEQAGMTTSLASLGGFFLMDDLDVIASGRDRRFTDRGRTVPGLNWTSATGDLDTANTRILEVDEDGNAKAPEVDKDGNAEERKLKAPWPEDSYVVSAGTRPDGIVLRRPDGSELPVRGDVFVEVVAADVARLSDRGRLSRDTEIVLVIPFMAHGYATLPRMLSGRTGLKVWGHTGEAVIPGGPVDPGTRRTVEVVSRPTMFEGDWLASTPGLAPDPDDDPPAWHHEVWTQPIVSSTTGLQIGRSSHDVVQQRFIEDDQRHLDQIRTYLHRNKAANVTFGETELPRPGPESKAYRLDLHGVPGALSLYMRDGSYRAVGPSEAGGWLRRRKSLTSLPKDHWIDMVVCFSGSPADSSVPVLKDAGGDGFRHAFVADPLRQFSMSQHVSNPTGRWVRMSTTSQSTHLDFDGRHIRSVYTDVQGRLGRFDLRRPHPEGAELDRRVRVAGFAAGAQVSDEERARTLPLVEALRLVFGPYVDDASDYDDLLRGVAAVDQMWSTDGTFDDAGWFTLDLLQRVIAARPEATWGVNQRVARRVLAAAAEHWATYPGSPRIDTFIWLPAVDAAVEWMQANDLDAEASAVLNLRQSDVGVPERSRMFWARVKAEETLASQGPRVHRYINRVLHRPWPGPTSQEERENALYELTRGFAVGREMSDVKVAAAYTLELGGAFTDTSLVTSSDGGDGAGRDFTDDLLTRRVVDLTKVITAAGELDVPWEADKAAPYLLRVTPEASYGQQLPLHFGGGRYRSHRDDLAALVASDPELMRQPLSADVVLVFSETPELSFATDLAAELAALTGRTVHWNVSPADLSGRAGSRAVLTFASVRAHTVGEWHRTPPGYDEDVKNPRPLPAPLPRSIGRSRADALVRAGGAGQRGSFAPRTAVVQALSEDGSAAARGVEVVSAGTVPSVDSRADATVRMPSASVPQTSGSVFTAPVAAAGVRALPALPSHSLVRFAPESDVASEDNTSDIERLAFEVAEAGLRNRSEDVALPRIDITGYGADVSGPNLLTLTGHVKMGRRRARSAGALFRSALGRALDSLQQRVRAGEARLTAADFTVVEQGAPKAPRDLVGRGDLAGLSRPELGRQAVIAVSLPPEAAALQTLDVLRGREREWRGKALDVDAVARRVLHRTESLWPQERAAFFALVNKAEQAGMATSLASLSAFRLMNDLDVIVSGRARRFTERGRPVLGLNWASATGDLDTAHNRILETYAAGGLSYLGRVRARWAADPYVLSARGTITRDSLIVRQPNGSEVEVSFDEAVELVAADIARLHTQSSGRVLTRNTEIVLAIAYAGAGYAELTRKLSDRTGLTVWAHTGDVVILENPVAPGAERSIDVLRHAGQPQGEWFATTPGLAPDPEDAPAAWESEVFTHPIVSAVTHRQIGRAYHNYAFMAKIADDIRHFDQMSTFLHYHPGSGEFFGETELPRPGPESKAHRLDMHGAPGRLVMDTHDGGTLEIVPRQNGGWLKRRKSLTSLPKDYWIDMVVCHSGSSEDSSVPVRKEAGLRGFPNAFNADPLRNFSAAHHVATPTQRWVRMSTFSQGTTRGAGGRPARYVTTDLQGRLGRFDLVRPHPEGAEFDRRVRVAGFAAGAQVTDEERARTLPLVEALRLVFGPYVDDASDYDDLLRGVADVDRMWSAQAFSGDAGWFTLDLLQRVIAAHPEAASGVNQRVARRVLTAATAHWVSHPGAPLTSFVQLPRVDDAVEWTKREILTVEASYVLDMPEANVGVAERSRMFWARVKAEETLAAPGRDVNDFVARVLHERPSPVADDDREDALDKLTRGFAVGREMSDVNVAGAYTLELSGAFADTALTTRVGSGQGAGRDFTGEGVPSVVDMTQFITPDGTEAAPWGDTGYLLRVTPHAYLLDSLDMTFNGLPRVAHRDDLPELMAWDPELMREDLTVPVVLVFSGRTGRAEDMAGTLAQRLGRVVWWNDYTADLSGTIGSRAAIRFAGPGAHWTGPPPPPVTWRVARPVAPVKMVMSPLPSSAPLPRSAGQDVADARVPGGATRSAVPGASASPPRAASPVAARAGTAPVAPVAEAGVRASSDSLVAFAPGADVPSPEGAAGVQRLASETAEAGLRNWREGRALPSLVITGYAAGADPGSRQGLRRATSVADLLRQALGRALDNLQKDASVGELRLVAADFTIETKTSARVSKRMVEQGYLARVSRSVSGARETDPTPVTATASHAPAPSPMTGTHSPVPTPVAAATVTPSPTASQQRPVTQTVPFPGHDEDLRVLGVVGDGDCFFVSLLVGLHHQGHDSALTAMDVPQLRQHAADRFHGSERYQELNRRDALDVLVQDLDANTLSQVLGTPPPRLSREQNQVVEDRLRDSLYGAELRRLADPADRAVLADLNQATVRALLPGYQPDVRSVPRDERKRLIEVQQAIAMRAQLRDALTGDDPERAERLWNRLLETRYGRWAEQSPQLADFRGRRLGDLITDSIRSTDLWTTPFFDYAPTEVAHALDLNLTLVQRRDGTTWDTPVNSGAGRPVYLHYNGTDHYSAIENSPAPAGEAPAAESFVRPATASSDRAEELVSLLRGRGGLGIEDHILDRLRTLSARTVDALLGGGSGGGGAKDKEKPSNHPHGGKGGNGGRAGELATESSSSPSGPVYKTVLTHPGYATGDQFGIAAALHGDPNLHVLVDSAAPGTDSRDKGPEIAEFYRSSGIAPERIHFQQGPHDRTAKKRSEEIVREINKGAQDFDKLSKNKLSALSVSLGTGTTWIGNHFSHALRDRIREGWRLDDVGFPPEDRAKVAAWLAGRGITVEPGRKVIVLWSRFSGKRGDIHVEHDTSYTGMDQLLTGIHERTKDDPSGPLVVIAGDAKVNPQRPDHYPALTAKHRNNGLAVHDLTDFWNDREGVATWGGDTRIGQMRLYEYLNRQSGGELKHLGFRSGNLEAMALSGHQVRYLEEPGSIGGNRMAKWHADNPNSKSAVKTGYERITIVRPTTLSGQIAVEARAVWEKKVKEEYGKKQSDPLKADELKNLETAFKHPAWVLGKNNERGAEKPYKDPRNRGFHEEDVKQIIRYLVGGPRPEPTRLVGRPVTGGERLQKLADGDVSTPSATVRRRSTAPGGETGRGPANPATRSGVAGRLTLTPGDQELHERAIGHLTDLAVDESRRVNEWALARVSADHHIPLEVEPTVVDHGRQRLRSDFVSMVAYTFGTRGARAAEELSLRLAHDYGTRRTRQARGGAPGDALPVQVAQARYLQEAERFEQDLARYLSDHEAATAELRKMARAAWQAAHERGLDDKQLRKFGTTDAKVPGAVGTSRTALEAVVREGNSRELETFVFRGITTYLMADLLGGELINPVELNEERDERVLAEPSKRAEEFLAKANMQRVAKADKKRWLREAVIVKQMGARAADVWPPLSETERKFINQDDVLPWVSGASLHAMREGSILKTRSRTTGGLVLTGTSGSMYRFLATAERMNQEWNSDLDLGLIRLAVMGSMLSVRHHTFHETMRGAQLFLRNLPGHDPALDYIDDWSRYLRLAPLTEAELRSVANGGKFPHEHALDMLRPHLAPLAGGPQDDGKGKARADEPVPAADLTPADAQAAYGAARARHAEATAALADAVLSDGSGEGSSANTRLTVARTRLAKAERTLAEATQQLAGVGLDITLRPAGLSTEPTEPTEPTDTGLGSVLSDRRPMSEMMADVDADVVMQDALEPVDRVVVRGGSGAPVVVSVAPVSRPGEAAGAVLPPEHVSALRTLDVLRSREPELRDGPLDVDGLARRVLHLDSAAPVGESLRKELLDLVGGAVQADSARSLAALGAFHLVTLGVLEAGGNPGFTVNHVQRGVDAHGRPDFTVERRSVPGLHWSPRSVLLNPGFTRVVRVDKKGSRSRIGGNRTAPWRGSETPYVVDGGQAGRPDAVRVTAPGRSGLAVPQDELVELIAADVARKGVPSTTGVVLVVSFAASGYLDLPRKLFDRTGMPVWAHSGEVELDGDGVITVVQRAGQPQGDWFLTGPGLVSDPDDATDDWHRDVVTWPVVGDSGAQAGRALFSTAEWAKEEHRWHRLDMTTFVHQDVATGASSAPEPMPQPGPAHTAYVFGLHGGPNGFGFPMKDGSVRGVRPQGAVGYLKRRRSLAGKDWIDLVACFAGSPEDAAVPSVGHWWYGFPGVFVADRLRQRSPAHHFANGLDRPVRMSYGSQSMGTEEKGRYTRAVQTDARGRRGAIDVVWPDPSGGELDRLVAVAGFAEGQRISDEERVRTLVLVEALRQLFKRPVDRESGFDGLLRGAADVDRMWSGDPDFAGAGWFTLDLLERVIMAHPESAGGVDQETVRRVLADAARQWQKAPGTRLVGGFVDLPAVSAAQKWMRRQKDFASRTARLLRLSETEVGTGELSRMFWARVKAEETLAAQGARARAFMDRLHLDDSSERVRADALRWLTEGFAVGRDMSDVDMAAAYVLERKKAFAGTGLITGTGARTGSGRDFTGEKLPRLVDLSQFAVPAGLKDAPWAGPGVASAQHAAPEPYVLRIAPNADDPDFLSVSFGGTTYRSHMNELVELIARDPEQMSKARAVPVVLVSSNRAALLGSLADRLAQVLGRKVSWTDSPADYSRQGASGRPVLTFDEDVAWAEAVPARLGTALAAQHSFGEPLSTAPVEDPSGLRNAHSGSGPRGLSQDEGRPQADTEPGHASDDTENLAEDTRAAETDNPADLASLATPSVPGDAEARRWIARQVTDQDLPSTFPAPAVSETTTREEMGAIGISLSPSQATELELRGDDRLPLQVLSPLDQLRIRITRPEPWTHDVAEAAGSTSRRLWAQAYDDFAQAAPETAGPEISRAWSTALSTLLPDTSEETLADPRYSGDAFREAVRQVAGRLLGGDTPNGSADTRAHTSGSDVVLGEGDTDRHTLG
ncbi:lonely Cys domain-containing protein [Streptomyces sp. SAI-124]|uniref:lonely Cys domain-containing protein n=1 Tax=Streptomyces sp. SAI-124 TaxID=3377730 RepID=UPI003C7C3D6A